MYRRRIRKSPGPALRRAPVNGIPSLHRPGDEVGDPRRVLPDDLLFPVVADVREGDLPNAPVRSLLVRIQPLERGLHVRALRGERPLKPPVGQVADRRQGPEVGRQGEHRPARALENPLHLVVGVDVGPAEPVDGLLGVAHHEERAGAHPDLAPGGLLNAFAGQEQDHLGLHRVRVLELVHEQVGEPPLEIPPHLRVFPNQRGGLEQQVVVVQGGVPLPPQAVTLHRRHHQVHDGGVAVLAPPVQRLGGHLVPEPLEHLLLPPGHIGIRPPVERGLGLALQSAKDPYQGRVVLEVEVARPRKGRPQDLLKRAPALGRLLLGHILPHRIKIRLQLLPRPREVRLRHLLPHRLHLGEERHGLVGPFEGKRVQAQRQDPLQHRRALQVEAAEVLGPARLQQGLVLVLLQLGEVRVQAGLHGALPQQPGAEEIGRAHV